MSSADRIKRRQLTELVGFTAGERLRCLWYELRLAVQEMNYANYRLLDNRVPATLPRDVTGPRERS
jgi:hypothetical protein